ncbi:T9SS type A sorting domain-containing protein [Flavobacterium amniphilum]|uniref:T9SS type A sorting domain-containing protein n=1 Tax=Flavobacterium amniphilum TaxID=1834035 RepID=UPI00202A7C3E|nr:T9SS type A sorting domain-containing protein [Flavobacterium amniphilum]MCL9805767.1 T9SS type A sorting domain-containing protein [Flavobacterium amniphilum]MCL9806354.1 T9SS type A sorting domain-containing protein [Flavobacterium amniphilum]
MRLKHFILTLILNSSILLSQQHLPSKVNTQHNSITRIGDDTPLDPLEDLSPDTPIDESLFSIEILNLTTNGLIQPNNTINFNGKDDLVIEFDVKASYYGTYNTGFINNLRIGTWMFNPNNHNNQTAEDYDNGVRSYYLVSEIVNLEKVNNYYTKTVHQKITLRKYTISNTGYTFQTNMFSIGLHKNLKRTDLYKLAGGTSESYPNNIPDRVEAQITDLKYSDNLPILNNKIVVPNTAEGYSSIDFKINYSLIHGSNLVSGYYGSMNIAIHNPEGSTLYTTLLVTPKIFTNYIGSETYQNIQIPSSKLINGAKIIVTFQFQGTNFPFILAESVIKSDLISNNLIHENKIVAPGSIVSLTNNYLPSIISTKVCPYRTDCEREIKYINYFKWQYKTTNENTWHDFVNQNSNDLINIGPINEDTLIRRIAIDTDNGFYNISNTISISINNSIIVNTICCDQTLTSLVNPSIFTGNAVTNSNLKYKWQMAKTGENINFNNDYVWTDIPNATGKDFQYIYTSNLRPYQYLGFRRLITENGIVKSISNPIAVIRRVSSARTMQDENEDSDSIKMNQNDFEITSPYPNPNNGTFYLKNDLNLGTSFYLVDTYSRRIKNFSFTTKDEEVEFKIDDLPNGIYFLKSERNNSFLKKIIKE